MHCNNSSTGAHNAHKTLIVHGAMYYLFMNLNLFIHLHNATLLTRWRLNKSMEYVFQFDKHVHSTITMTVRAEINMFHQQTVKVTPM